MRFLARSFACRSFAAAAIAFACGSAAAQGYPAKPVRVVVPFPPGQATEIMGRLLAEKLAESMGQSFTVDNRPGASGIIGVEHVAKSPPDGYTLLVTASGTMVINPHLYTKLSYDPLRDFAPIALLGIFPLMAVVHPAVPARNIRELVALAKSRSGELNFASSGAGTAPHLAAEMFKYHAGVELVHIPYKGSGPALADLLGGRVTMMFDTVTSSLPHVQSGKLRAIAVTAAARTSALPDVPTAAESGVPDMVAVGWAGLLAPAGTPREIVARLNAESTRILSRPDVRERLLAIGCDPAPGTAEDFVQYMRTESARWAQAVKAAGVKLD